MTFIAWALGNRWTTYIAMASIALIGIALAYRMWRANVREDYAEHLRAQQSLEALSRIAKGMEVDNSIRSLSLSARRERLRQWATPPNGGL